MPKKTVLNKQSRKMVYDVYCFMKREADDGILIDLKQVLKRTAEATETSISFVKKVMDEANHAEYFRLFRAGRKRSRTKPLTEVDSFERGIIKRTVHNFYKTYKELPTIEKLRKILQQNINFCGSERSLRLVISDLGFKWKKTDNRKLLLEKSNVRLQRILYLEKITKFRNEGRSVIFLDESYIDASDTAQKCLTSVTDAPKGAKKPVIREKRLVIIHAGSETGFVPHALLTLSAGSKPGDYHNMSFDNFELWLRTQLIPNIPQNAVIVVHNAPFLNKQYDRPPTANSKRALMESWLTDKGIDYGNYMLKPQLFHIIKHHRDRYTKFHIDKILNEYGLQILRLPPFHPDLNPLEMVWASIKGYISSQNISFNVNHISEIVKERVSQIDAYDWAKLCMKVKENEEQYKSSDVAIDDLTEEFSVHVDDDDYSDSDSSGDEYDDSEGDEETPHA